MSKIHIVSNRLPVSIERNGDDLKLSKVKNEKNINLYTGGYTGLIYSGYTFYEYFSDFGLVRCT